MISLSVEQKGGAVTIPPSLRKHSPGMPSVGVADAMAFTSAATGLSPSPATIKIDKRLVPEHISGVVADLRSAEKDHSLGQRLFDERQQPLHEGDIPDIAAQPDNVGPIHSDPRGDSLGAFVDRPFDDLGGYPIRAILLYPPPADTTPPAKNGYILN